MRMRIEQLIEPKVFYEGKQECVMIDTDVKMGWVDVIGGELVIKTYGEARLVRSFAGSLLLLDEKDKRYPPLEAEK